MTIRGKSGKIAEDRSLKELKKMKATWAGKKMRNQEGPEGEYKQEIT